MRTTYVVARVANGRFLLFRNIFKFDVEFFAIFPVSIQCYWWWWWWPDKRFAGHSSLFGHHWMGQFGFWVFKYVGRFVPLPAAKQQRRSVATTKNPATNRISISEWTLWSADYSNWERAYNPFAAHPPGGLFERRNDDVASRNIQVSSGMHVQCSMLV